MSAWPMRRGMPVTSTLPMQNARRPSDMPVSGDGATRCPGRGAETGRKPVYPHCGRRLMYR